MGWRKGILAPPGRHLTFFCSTRNHHRNAYLC